MSRHSLSEALFTTTQRRVLGLLYGNPQRSFYTNEIARHASVGKGSLSRELERLQRAGILRTTRLGNQVHYQANPDCPIYSELLGIVRKTFGIAGQGNRAISPPSIFLLDPVMPQHAITGSLPC